MELYVEMLRRLLEKETVQVTFPNLTLTPRDMLDSVAYRALERIWRIVRDPSLDDPECFRKIESIICILEELGSGGGGRHDFC